MPCLLHKEGRGGGCRPAFFLPGGVGARLLAAGLVALPFLTAGCTFNVSDVGRSLAGRTLPAGQAHPELQAEPDRWVLIENPRYQEGDPEGRREPRYVWAERDRLPLTVNRAIGGTRVILAPSDVQARYASDRTPPAPRP